MVRNTAKAIIENENKVLFIKKRLDNRRKNKSKQYDVGVITVIHTFGRDLKINIHIHALVTEGALDKDEQ